MDRGVLLATFVRGEEAEIDKAIEKILDTVALTNKFIFVLAQKADPSKKIITYNSSLQGQAIIKNEYYTIRVHRKKKTNTLYTINGLNLAIEAEHGGQRGKHLKLDWEKYRSHVLVSHGNTLKAIPTVLEKILEIKFD
jgi:hypothetical protein